MIIRLFHRVISIAFGEDERCVESKKEVKERETR